MPNPRVVVVEGVQHTFPSDATDAEISAALETPPSQGWQSSLASIASPAGREGLKQYGKELLTGDGMARSAVADYGKKEGGAFLSTLNPVNQIKGVLRAVTTNPLTTVGNLINTGKSALEGDPEAVGSVLGMAVAPNADAGILRGVNSAATAVADSSKLQGTAGYIGGAGVGIAGGGHPFIMGRIGQAAAPAIGGAARSVANVTGKVMDTLGMGEKPLPYSQRDIAPSPIGPPTQLDVFRSQGFDPYAPNISSGSQAIPTASMAMPKGIAQGVYTQLSDGSWGVQALPGYKLVTGEPVNVANRAGQMSVHTVGKIGPDGVGMITADAPLPSEPISIHGKTITDPAVLEAIRKRLSGQP